jgi:hypothetical protein
MPPKDTRKRPIPARMRATRARFPGIRTRLREIRAGVDRMRPRIRGMGERFRPIHAIVPERPQPTRSSVTFDRSVDGRVEELRRPSCRRRPVVRCSPPQ